MASERNSNSVPSLTLKSNADDDADVIAWADPTTHRLLVDATTGNPDSEYAEDSAHQSGDTGLMILAVRNDAGTALAGTTGDYIPLSTDNTGALRVTGGGGGTQYDEDDAHQSGDTGTLALVVRKDSAAALAGTDGDYTALITDANGRLHVLDANSAAIKTAVETLDNAISGNEMQVDVVGALPAGTNNIGDVDILSIAAGDNNIGNVDIASAIPAGTNLIGKVSASVETNTVYDGTTALTPKFAVIDAASSGDNTIVSAVVGKKVRVLSCFMVAAGSVNVRFESGAGGTALTGQMNLAANGGFVLPFNPTGWFETASNTLLNLELSGATSVDGSLVYVEV